MYSLPNEILLEISSYLEYPDAYSFAHVNKVLRSLHDEDYWKRKSSNQEKPRYLSWQGYCAKEAAQAAPAAQVAKRGSIFRGAENFLGIQECIQRAYCLEEAGNNLLLYFIRILLREKRMCFHAISAHLVRSNLEEYVVSNLLRTCLIDDRENTFLLLFREVKENNKLYKRFPLYILAKSRGLEAAQASLIPTASCSMEWIVYAIQTKDYLLFSTLYPREKGKKRGVTHDILKIYSWPEVTPLLESYTGPNITLKSGNATLTTEIPLPVIHEIDRYLANGLIGYLARYDHEAVRERITSFVQVHDDIYYSYFKRYHLNSIQVSEVVSKIFDSIYYLTIPAYLSLEKREEQEDLLGLTQISF